ncbi:MAG: elongation factor P [Chloroflexi bacterium]|nr:elongation factor P [Chloroflexota bacterium]
MIDVNQLRKGTTFLEDGQIWKVNSYSHHKPGRGAATIRVHVRNMRTGATREMTFTSGGRVQNIQVENRQVQYLYADDEFLTFMDMETYEQPQMRRDVFGDDMLFLKENTELILSTYESEIIDYELPTSVEMQVTEAEPGYAGDTANNPTKKVTVETGLEVTVPIFVNVGDVIRIKTEDASYMTRV